MSIVRSYHANDRSKLNSITIHEWLTASFNAIAQSLSYSHACSLNSAGEQFRRCQEAKQPQATTSGRRRRAKRQQQATASLGIRCDREHQMVEVEHGASCSSDDGDEPAEPKTDDRRASRRRAHDLASPVEAAAPASLSARQQHRAAVRRRRAVDGGDDAGRDRAPRPRHRGGLPVLVPVRRALRPRSAGRRRRRQRQGHEQWSCWR